MSDADQVLGLVDGLVDDLRRVIDGSPAAAIEVQVEGVTVLVTRRGGSRPGATASGTAERAPAGDAEPTTPLTQRVHATTVGIFSTAREWRAGDAVTRGQVLGGIQSLGHIADVVAPADGEIREVLVAGGAPVEYGQPILVIALR